MAKPLWMQVREAFERKNYYPPSSELRDELVGIATDYAEQKVAAARTEIERLTKERDLAEARYTKACQTIEVFAQRAEKAEAEIERLKQGAVELATTLNEAAAAQIRAAEAERDAAQVQMTALAEENRRLREKIEALPRSTYSCGTQWVRLEQVLAALSSTGEKG